MPPSTSITTDELRAFERVDARPLPRLLCFLLLYCGGAAAALELARAGESWLLRAPLYLLAAASLHGVSLFTHEGVHGSLSTRPWLNRLASAACALPVLQNYAAYKVLHLRHHADLGGGRDPDLYANYTGRRWLELSMHWGRLLLGYPAYVTLIPLLALRHGRAEDRAWIVAELLGLGGAIAAAIALVPWPVLLHGWLIPMAIVNTLVNVRGMSQHTFLPEVDHPIRGSRTILSNPVTRFFMCNENYHLEHHLHPRVPWYNLPALHRKLREELVAQEAPFIPSYLSFVAGVLSGRLSLRKSP